MVQPLKFATAASPRSSKDATWTVDLGGNALVERKQDQASKRGDLSARYSATQYCKPCTHPRSVFIFSLRASSKCRGVQRAEATQGSSFAFADLVRSMEDR
jgi:hypothetical protein